MRRLTPVEERFIDEAAAFLESPRFVQKITQIVGQPIERGLQRLPAQAQALIHQSSHKAIEAAFRAGLATLDTSAQRLEFEDALRAVGTTRAAHGAGTAITGAVGGFFGLPGLALELPVTTTVMLRSISRIARDWGEDLTDPAARLECLYVFSLGSPEPADDATESAYYASRIAFAQMISQAMSFLSGKTAKEVAKALQKKGAPALFQVLARIASRFEISVGKKSLGQLIPGIGAGLGAALNVAFSEHFNETAKYHFGLRRLERECGAEEVRSLYGLARARSVQK